MKKIKSITAILLMFVLMFSLAGCGEIKKAETAVNGMFAAFKELNMEEAQKYVNVEDITSAGNDANENADLVVKTLFDDLAYEIISSEKIDSKTVVVKTKITAIAMKPVLAEYLTQGLQYALAAAFANPQPSDEEIALKMEEIFLECASKPDLATVVNEVDIKVVKTESKEWKIESDDTLANALLGGFIDAAAELENSVNTEE